MSGKTLVAFLKEPKIFLKANTAVYSSTCEARKCPVSSCSQTGNRKFTDQPAGSEPNLQQRRTHSDAREGLLFTV
jgi:hypothetical protein